MYINSKTKISKLIKENAKTIEVISTINKNFRKLKNPVLRKTLASRVSIADAAKIGGVPVCIIIDKLKKIGFTTETDCICETMEKDTKLEFYTKTINMKREKIVELDVRPSLEKGIDPFDVIMEKLKVLKEDETLLIINTFEPIPLLNMLKPKGYIFETERPENGVVHTFIEKSDKEVKEEHKESREIEISFEEARKKFTGKMKEIDVRHLEMPLPMVTILEEIEGIDKDTALFVHHKKLPQFLIPELEKRDFKWVSKELDETNVKLIIFK